MHSSIALLIDLDEAQTPLLAADTGTIQKLLILYNFSLDKRCEFYRRAVHGFCPLTCQPLARVARAQDIADFQAQAFNDGWGRAARGEDAVPITEIVARYRFGYSGNVGGGL